MRISTTVLAVLAVFSINSQAGFIDEKEHLNHQFSSKRPYQAAPEKNTYRAGDKWEGATLQNLDGAKSNSEQIQKNEKQLNLHFLGRRPYSESGSAE